MKVDITLLPVKSGRDLSAHIHKFNLGDECACPVLRGSGLMLGIQEQQ